MVYKLINKLGPKVKGQGLKSAESQESRAEIGLDRSGCLYKVNGSDHPLIISCDALGQLWKIDKLAYGITDMVHS